MPQYKLIKDHKFNSRDTINPVGRQLRKDVLNTKLKWGNTGWNYGYKWWILMLNSYVFFYHNCLAISNVLSYHSAIDYIVYTDLSFFALSCRYDIWKTKHSIPYRRSLYILIAYAKIYIVASCCYRPLVSLPTQLECVYWTESPCSLYSIRFSSASL